MIYFLSGGNIQSWREEQKVEGQEGKVKKPQTPPTWNRWRLETGFRLIQLMINWGLNILDVLNWFVYAIEFNALLLRIMSH